MTVLDLPSYSFYARQIVAKMLSADILARFPECQSWLKKHATDLHDWQIALPLISCLAVGGSLEDGIQVASAWYPMCLAAAILDDVEDREFLPDDVIHSPEQAINLGTALIFLSLHHLSSIQSPGGAVRAEVVFSTEGFTATSGQNQDLLAATPLSAVGLPVNDVLEKYWQTIILKSGSIFRMGIAGGAAAGTSDKTVIKGLGDYGTALGVMIQLLDDGKDIFKTSQDVIQAWEVSLPLLLYLLATEKDKVVFPMIHTRAEWHTSLREARIIEIFSDILLQWKARTLESIQGLALLHREKKMLDEFPMLLSGLVTERRSE